MGWDWFSFQLSDGSELMHYQLRHRDGSADPFSAGMHIPAQGEPVRLSRDDMRLEVLDTWRVRAAARRTRRAGGSRVPSRQLVLELAPALADQELPVTVRYWEGAVRLQGTTRASRSPGRGYVELTGYGEATAPAPSPR